MRKESITRTHGDTVYAHNACTRVRGRATPGTEVDR